MKWHAAGALLLAILSACKRSPPPVSIPGTDVAVIFPCVAQEKVTENSGIVSHRGGCTISGAAYEFIWFINPPSHRGPDQTDNVLDMAFRNFSEPQTHAPTRKGVTLGTWPGVQFAGPGKSERISHVSGQFFFEPESGRVVGTIVAAEVGDSLGLLAGTLSLRSNDAGTVAH